MVVPTVGIIPGNDYGGFIPFWALHERVDRIDDEDLFVNRVGVAGMSILVRSRFQITYRWQTSFLESGEEILQIILVVGLIGLADKGWAAWA